MTKQYALHLDVKHVSSLYGLSTLQCTIYMLYALGDPAFVRSGVFVVGARLFVFCSLALCGLCALARVKRKRHPLFSWTAFWSECVCVCVWELSRRVVRCCAVALSGRPLLQAEAACIRACVCVHRHRAHQSVIRRARFNRFRYGAPAHRSSSSSSRFVRVREEQYSVESARPRFRTHTHTLTAHAHDFPHNNTTQKKSSSRFQ